MHAAKHWSKKIEISAENCSKRKEDKMSSKIQISPVAAAAALSSVKTTNGTIGTAESLFSSVKVLRQVERDNKKASSTISQLSSIYENHYQIQKHSFQDKEVSNKVNKNATSSFPFCLIVWYATVDCGIKLDLKT